MIDMNIINDLIPVFVGLFIVMYIVKYVNAYMSNKEKKRRVDKPRDHNDRIMIGDKKIAKLSSLLYGKPVYLKGDSLIPPHKIGYTVTGVVAHPEEYITYIQPKWYHRYFFWKPPMCLHIEPELCGDLNGGELHIRGTGLQALGEDVAYVTPPKSSPDELSIEDVEKRRSDVALKRAISLLNFDLNNSLARNVLIAMGGGREEEALLPLYSSGEIPRMEKERADRERQREREKLEARSTRRNNYDELMGQGGL